VKLRFWKRKSKKIENPCHYCGCPLVELGGAAPGKGWFHVDLREAADCLSVYRNGDYFAFPYPQIGE
jgi:hypothetical protein